MIYPDLRRTEITDLAQSGEVEVRPRENPEACPNCKGVYGGLVYRWLFSEVVSVWGEPDPRWFCYCGYTEVPDGDVESWREVPSWMAPPR